MLPIIIENYVTVRTREIGFLDTVYIFHSQGTLRGVVFAKFLARPRHPVVWSPFKGEPVSYNCITVLLKRRFARQPVYFEEMIGYHFVIYTKHLWHTSAKIICEIRVLFCTCFKETGTGRKVQRINPLLSLLKECTIPCFCQFLLVPNINKDGIYYVYSMYVKSTYW